MTMDTLKKQFEKAPPGEIRVTAGGNWTVWLTDEVKKICNGLGDNYEFMGKFTGDTLGAKIMKKNK